MPRLNLVSLLDIRLALRMLAKHPVLNLAAVFALSVGIPIGLAPSHVERALKAPLPTDTDDRVRAIRLWDPLAASVAPTWDGDFRAWERSLRSFSSIAAVRTSTFNVATSELDAMPASGAQLSASGFSVLGARALFGRVLDAGDFEAGAPDVAVIGHSLWSSRFGRDPGVLGKTLRIGRRPYVVVGVMPEGFAFPANEALWTPLRTTSVGGVEERARVQVFGRLSTGVTPAQAQAEVAAMGVAPLAFEAEPSERERLRAEVVPFGLLYLGLPADGLSGVPEFRYVQALMFVLLLVACGNVAMLVFARTATRLRELAIRTALGASRARIVSQVFVETAVLAVIAAGVGIVAVDQALRFVNVASIAGAEAMPYWLSLGMTVDTALQALLLAVVSAAVAGMIPAVAITGRAFARHLTLGSRVRFGRLTGALMVTDIAVSVAAVGMAFAIAGQATDTQAAERAAGIPSSEYLAVEFRLPPTDDARAVDRLAADQRRLVEALEREPGIRSVAIGDALPRMEHRSRTFEVEGEDRAAGAPARWVRQARVDAGYFEALGVRLLAGRDFLSTDVEGGAPVAIVNTAFVQREFGAGDAIGKRVRFTMPGDTAAAVWHEIVGVVGHLGVNLLNPERGEAVYLPAAPGTINPMQLAVHTTLPPANLIARVREVALATTPDLIMGQAQPLTDVRQGDWYLVMGLVAGLLTLVGVLVALATSGLYAMLSLAVTERTREIGIRAALGASRRALVATILRRSLVQVGIGALIGLPLASRFVFELLNETGGASAPHAVTIAVALALGIVGLVALGSCLMPTRRILAIEASEAMRAEG